MPKNTSSNKHIIKLIVEKELYYRPMYSLSLVELEILKIYIETYLKTRFIQLFHSLINIPILNDKKPDSNLPLYINYEHFHNLTIKKSVATNSNQQDC